MQALPHQIETANKAEPILKELGYVYINGQPRTGKTLTSILLAEKCDKVTSVMVLTPKQAIPGWLKFVNNLALKKKYMVINYEQLGTYNKQKRQVSLKHNPRDYQLVIIDESHNVGSYPVPSGRQLVIRAFCSMLPHIHLSGTPVIESACGIYHQMAISYYNPFNMFKDFYAFHRHYGIPHHIDIRGQSIAKYDKFKPELLEYISKFMVNLTQKDAGIANEVVDVLHYVELTPETKKLYNTVLNKRVALDGELVCDTVMKLRTSLHMIEGGCVLVNEEYKMLDNDEKIKYIYEKFGDTEDTGIMCHFVGERMKLEKVFKKAKIYSSTSHAEGVDLSHLSNFVIYSSGYSGAKFVQRRERIANLNGSKTTKVHHILVKGAISDQVYKAVSKKRDFNNSLFESVEL